jgi:hypothetical protein
MRRWKRLLLVLCVLIAAVVALILWTSQSQPAPTLSLSFIGYTNRPVPAGFQSKFATNSSNAITAILYATNSGPVGLRLWGVHYSVLPTNDYPRSWNGTENTPGGLPSPVFSMQILEPGESARIEVYMPPRFDSWSAEAHYSRWGLMETAGLWAANKGNATTRRWLERIVPWREVLTIQSGPITNQPPAALLGDR